MLWGACRGAPRPRPTSPPPSPPPPRPRPGAAASSAPRPPAASVLAARRCLAVGDRPAPAARSRRRRRCRRPALRTGSPAACPSWPRPSQGPWGGTMEADGAGEQMRPLLTRVRSGEAEARRQRRRRGGGWRGLAAASARRRRPLCGSWGSRGAAGPEPSGGQLSRGRACPPVCSQPRGAVFSCRVDAAVLRPRRLLFLRPPRGSLRSDRRCQRSVECWVAGPGEGPCARSSPGPHSKREDRATSPADPAVPVTRASSFGRGGLAEVRFLFRRGQVALSQETGEHLCPPPPTTDCLLS